MRVIEGLWRDPEKMRDNPSAIRSADKFRCYQVAKTRGVTSTISASEWPRLCLHRQRKSFQRFLIVRNRRSEL